MCIRMLTVEVCVCVCVHTYADCGGVCVVHVYGFASHTTPCHGCVRRGSHFHVLQVQHEGVSVEEDSVLGLRDLEQARHMPYSHHTHHTHSLTSH